jgi:hypothetical protein
MVPSNASARHGDGLRQCRVRVNRQADVSCVGAHLDRQRWQALPGQESSECAGRRLVWTPSVRVRDLTYPGPGERTDVWADRCDREDHRQTYMRSSEPIQPRRDERSVKSLPSACQQPLVRPPASFRADAGCALEWPIRAPRVTLEPDGCRAPIRHTCLPALRDRCRAHIVWQPPLPGWS